VNGCDLFTFRDGKLAIKNSYRKTRPLPGNCTFAAVRCMEAKAG
jgi:hypothetical protein